MEAYKQQIAKQKLLEQIVYDAAKEGEPTLAAQIGMFVVYVQQLEQIIKQILNITYSFKSYFDNNGYSVLYKTDSIIRDSDSLGTLVKLLKTINVRDEKTYKQVMDDFVIKLETFVQKRNNYIHKLLKDPSINDLAKLKVSVINANMELLELIDEAENKLSILNGLFELDGYPYTLARHMISSEKYKPKPINKKSS